MSVTSCSVCDGPLEGKYANALTCSSRCRQKAYRQRAKSEAPPRCNANGKASWTALRAKAGLTDDELRRIVTDRVVRARLVQPRVSAEDRRLFASEAVS